MRKFAGGPDQAPENNNNSDKKRGFWSAYWRTAWLPGIGSRLKDLGAHFGHFAYLLAMIYGAVKLIPANHPVLNPSNIGKFGFRDVVMAAADNVRLSRQTIDQALIFFAVLLGMAFIFIQFFLIIAFVAMDTMGGFQAAQAQVPLGEMFTPPNPETDVVYEFFGRMFGGEVMGIDAPTGPVQKALYAMMAFFSTALLIVATLLLLYYVVTIVVDAANTGKPFGRMNGFWGPIRIVMAFGLLIPVANGLNVAQYSVLQVAKMGSGMASQAWGIFANTFYNPDGDIATPQGTVTQSIGKIIFLNEVCALTYNRKNGGHTDVRLRRVQERDGGGNYVEGEFSSEGFRALAKMIGMPDNPWFDYAPKSETFIWSKKDSTVPLCGSLKVDFTNISNAANDDSGLVLDPKVIFQAHMNGVADILDALGGGTYEERKADSVLRDIYDEAFSTRKSDADSLDLDKHAGIPEAIKDAIDSKVNEAIDFDMSSLEGDDGSDLKERMKEQGWGSAGSFYHHIAGKNVEAMNALTSVSTEGTSLPQMYLEYLNAVSQGIPRPKADDVRVHTSHKKTLHTMYKAEQWYTGNEADEPATSAGFFGRALNFIFSNRMQEIRRNPTLNPLGQLFGAGADLVKSAYWSLSIGMLMQAGGVWAAIAGTPVAGPTIWTLVMLGGALKAMGGILMATAVIGLGVGFLLLYVIPLLPFMYFTFAVITWVAEIFEALVGAPLWALAHVRIDGEGLPGQAASMGYELLFGIMLRPIFILFGFIGGYLLFSAGVYFIHSGFEFAVEGIRSNMEFGVETRSGEMTSSEPQTNGIDHFFYSIVYVLMVYNIGMTSFKMVDTVPKGIMRWMGSNAQPFSDGKSDPFQEMQQAVAVGGYAAANSLSQAANSGMQGMGDSYKGGKQHNTQYKQNQEAEQEKRDAAASEKKFRDSMSPGWDK